VTGEASELAAAPHVSTGSALAVLYLIVFGSLVGFSTYMWLLRVASPTAVSTYAYVNPVVAVLLGVVLAGETLPPRAMLATLVIVGGVALVSLAGQLRKR
jgi:drug/metabolite transporter (DMT)-like permease